MFEINSNFESSHFFIRNEDGFGNYKYLHCDGRVIGVCEYFESRKAAQKVLDKFQPKPKHEWKHGDVFEHSGYGTATDRTMIYFCNSHRHATYVCCDRIAGNSCDVYLKDAKFLFNIKEKINEKNN